MKEKIGLISCLLAACVLIVWVCQKHVPTPPKLKTGPPKTLLLREHGKLKLSGRGVLVYSEGEYVNIGISTDSLPFTETNDPSLMGGGVGPCGYANIIETSLKMKQACNSLHNYGFLDVNGNAWFAGASSGNPYITGTGFYEANTDSAGNPITGGFIQMAAGWNNQDGEYGWFVGIRSSDSSLMICGDLQNGIRGNGTASANNMKWVPVTLPAGKKAKMIVSGFSVIVLCWDGTVYDWGVSGTYQSDLGYGTPTFGQSAGSYNGGYNSPHVVTGLSHIRMIAGGLNSNWALDSSNNLYAFGIYGWQMGHTTSVGSDPLNSPTLMNSKLNAPDIYDTVTTDMAGTHFLIGSGSVRRLFGIGSTEQGTLGNGLQLNYATYSPPYDNGGANEGNGLLVQTTLVEITPGKNNWLIILNGGFYAYADEAEDANGNWYGWGRNKPAYLAVGTQPIDSTAGNVASGQPNGWQRPLVTLLWNPFNFAIVTPSTSQGCNNACTPGPVSSSACTLNPPTCHTIHAGLSVTTNGAQIFISGTTSTYTGNIAYYTFSQVSGPSTAMGVRAYSINPLDTFSANGAGTYVYKIVVQGANWEVDSTTVSMTISAQTGFYFKAGGTGTACTSVAACAPSYLNTALTSAVGGDTFYLNRGDVFPVEVVNNASGTIGNPIVMRPYGTGNLPVLGGMLTQSGFTNVTGNLWEVSYTGPWLNWAVYNGSLQTQSTSPNISNGWFVPSSMTINSITDATNAGLVTTGTKIMIRSSAFTIDTAHVTGVVGSVISFSPNATYSGVGGLGWKIMNNTPDVANAEWQDTLSQFRVVSVGSPTGWQLPAVDTVLYSQGIYQEYDSLRFQGGNNANIILAFQGVSGLVFNADSIDYGFDGTELRSEGGTIWNNCVWNHFTSNGVYKQNTNNYNNAYNFPVVNDIGMFPGMGRPGANQGYSGILAGDSGSVVRRFSLMNIGYIGIANYGSGFKVDSGGVTNYCQTLGDGAAVYTWMASAVTFARQREIKNVVAVKGGSATTYLGTNLTTPLIAAAYLDNYSQQVTVSNCSSYLANGPAFFDHGPLNTFTNNTAYGSGFCDFYGSEVGPVITSLSVQNNIFGSATSTVPAIRIATINNDLSTFGTIDNNQIVGALRTNTPFWTFSTGGSDPGTFRTLPGWFSSTGYDQHSTFKVGYLFFFYNQLSTSANNTFLGVYADLSGGQHFGSIAISPYSSQLLTLSTVPFNTVNGSKLIVVP